MPGRERDVEAAVTAALGRFYRDREVVLVGGPLSQYADRVEALLRHGARPPFAVANGAGTGSAPEGLAGHHGITVDMNSFLAHRAGVAAVLGAPPDDVRAAVAAYDPDRDAIVLAEPSSAVAELDGRPVVDAQHPSWTRYEDPTAVDAFFDDSGVARLPSSVVAPAAGPLAAAVAERDLGYGVLCEVAARGGGDPTMELARWLADGEDCGPAADWLAARGAAVRVTPVLPGVHCAAHGFVLPDHVVVLHPYEVVVLRRGDRPSVVGCSTYARFAPDQVAAVLDTAARVGGELRRRAGLRGAFSVSGVLGASGFLATSVWTRFTTAHALAAHRAPELSLPLLHAALVAGHPLGVEGADLERHLRDRVTGAPGAVVSIPTARGPAGDQRTLWLSLEDGRLRATDAGAHSDGCVVHVPVGAAGKAVLIAGPALAGPGGFLTGAVVDACATVDRAWELGIGATPPPAARRGRGVV